MNSCLVLTLDSSRDKDKLPKSFILILTKSPLHSWTLVPYPLFSDSDILGDNLGVNRDYLGVMTLTRGTSAYTSASPCHVLVFRKYIPTKTYLRLNQMERKSGVEVGKKMDCE